MNPRPVAVVDKPPCGGVRGRRRRCVVVRARAGPGTQYTQWNRPYSSIVSSVPKCLLLAWKKARSSRGYSMWDFCACRSARKSATVLTPKGRIQTGGCLAVRRHGIHIVIFIPEKSAILRKLLIAQFLPILPQWLQQTGTENSKIWTSHTSSRALSCGYSIIQLIMLITAISGLKKENHFLFIFSSLCIS